MALHQLNLPSSQHLVVLAETLPICLHPYHVGYWRMYYSSLNRRKPMETSFHPLNRLSPPLPASFFSSLQHHFGGPPPQHDLKPRIHVLPEHQQRQVPPPLRIHEAHQPGRRVLAVLQLDGADGVGIQLQLEAAVQRPEKRRGIWDGDGKTHGKTDHLCLEFKNVGNLSFWGGKKI